VASDPRAPRVLCQGLVATDFLARTTFPVPKDRKVRVNEFVRQGGGPAANAAVGIARLGGLAAFAGAVGDDALGLEQIEDLAREGVGVAYVERVPHAGSFVSFILVDAEDGTRTIFSAPRDRPLARESSSALACDPDLVLVDGWGGPAQEALASAARDAGVPVLLDAGSARPEVLTLAGLAHVVIASEAFAEEWHRAGDPEGALARLLAHGAELVAITRGERGALARARGAREVFEVPRYPVDAVDTTGAGDAFHAGAAFGLAAGLTWERSLGLGAFVAARKCAALGARGGLPRREEAEAAGLLDSPAGRS
jgi:sugar/nucleoside kinase (ribokinase family)